MAAPCLTWPALAGNQASTGGHQLGLLSQALQAFQPWRRLTWQRGALGAREVGMGDSYFLVAGEKLVRVQHLCSLAG